MKKFSYAGIGHILAFVTIPTFVVTAIVTMTTPSYFSLPIARRVCITIGIILTTLWVLFYTYSLKYIFNKIRKNKIAKEGPYALCQHPLYASFIFLLIPAGGFILNSWLIFIPAIVMLIIFKILIPKEYKILEERYGEEWREYHKNTPEILPIGNLSIIRKKKL